MKKIIIIILIMVSLIVGIVTVVSFNKKDNIPTHDTETIDNKQEEIIKEHEKTEFYKTTTTTTTTEAFENSKVIYNETKPVPTKYDTRIR